MTSNVKGRGIRVEIAATYGSPIAVTIVTLANPAVATSVAHGLLNDMVGYFSGVVGMVQIENQACRVKNKTDDTFELQGLNTLAYSAFVSGNFTPVATWNTMGEVTAYDIPSGAGEKLPATTLLDVINKEEQGNPPAETISLTVIPQDSPSGAQQLLDAAFQAQAMVTGRITVGSNAVRIYRGEPSSSSESVSAGQIGSGGLDIAVKGRVLKLAA